jgi:hypothetical protein
MKRRNFLINKPLGVITLPLLGAFSHHFSSNVSLISIIKGPGADEFAHVAHVNKGEIMKLRQYYKDTGKLLSLEITKTPEGLKYHYVFSSFLAATKWTQEASQFIDYKRLSRKGFSFKYSIS